MENLPKDMAVEIAKLIAEQAVDPMKDLRSLRSSSTGMRDTCNTQDVGRSIALERVLRRGSWEPQYSEEYRNKLTSMLAQIGNPTACFYEGLRVVFIQRCGDLNPQIDMLQLAAASGNKVARYVLGILIHRGNTGGADDLKAKELLRQVEGDEEGDKQVWTNQSCTQMLQAAHQTIQTLKPQAGDPQQWVPLARPAPRYMPNHCRIAGCGNPGGWQGWQQWSRFCSEECRIEYECLRFFKSFW